MKRRTLVTAAAAAAFSACVTFGCAEEPDPIQIPRGDVDVFAADVQPIVDAQCANPSCHGRVERPLSLFSPGRYRMDPERTFLDEPLSRDELEMNARAVAAFATEVAPEGVDGCLVLRKPLALAAGGCGHEGGVIWSSRDDREHRLVRGWLARLVP